MVRPAFVVVATLVAAAACTRDRSADAPATDLALAVPTATDAGPTIRAPEQADYLQIPKAAPPSGSASPSSDDFEGIDVPECRDLLAWMRRCVGETAVRDIANNLKQATQSNDPQMRAAITDACRRMVEAYTQNGVCGP